MIAPTPGLRSRNWSMTPSSQAIESNAHIHRCHAFIDKVDRQKRSSGIPRCCGVHPKDTTRVPFRRISGTRTSSTRCATPSCLPPGSKVFGGFDPPPKHASRSGRGREKVRFGTHHLAGVEALLGRCTTGSGSYSARNKPLGQINQEA
jgi:hypothetical protein